MNRTVKKFLRTARIARLATLGRDGYPHVVPIYFALDGDDLIFGSDDHEQKVVNARRHRKGTVVIGGEPETDEAGYMIQGDLRVERDADRKLSRRLAARYESEEETEEWARGETVIIRLTPKKIIRVWDKSWN